MFLKTCIPVLMIFCTIILTYACTTSLHNKSGVETAMKKYDNLILKLDADAISLLFTLDGNLGNIAIGRDSIRKFIASFKNIKVLSQFSISNSVIIKGDSAIQKGTYKQTDLISDKDTLKVKGEFEVNWIWMKREGWLMNRMETKPVN